MFRRKIISFVSFFALFLVFIGSASAATNYDKLLPIAKKYIGVPYAYGGTSVTGFDCSGYINVVYKELGISLPRTTTGLATAGRFVERSELRIGDIVVFNTSGAGPSHAGIYIGENQFIHSQSGKGVSISNLDDPYYWKSRYLGARRVLSYNLGVGQFHDIPSSNWAYPIVHQLAQKDLVLGYENSYFKPLEPITRAEVAAMLAEAFDFRMNNRIGSFPDVATSHWAIGVVNAVYQEGIFKGNELNHFRPDDALKRGQMAAIIARTFNLKTPSTPIKITDVPPSHWAYNDIQKLAAAGITNPYPDGSFKPENYVTRSQFAAFLSRAMY